MFRTMHLLKGNRTKEMSRMMGGLVSIQDGAYLQLNPTKFIHETCESWCTLTITLDETWEPPHTGIFPSWILYIQSLSTCCSMHTHGTPTFLDNKAIFFSSALICLPYNVLSPILGYDVADDMKGAISGESAKSWFCFPFQYKFHFQYNFFKSLTVCK